MATEQKKKTHWAGIIFTIVIILVLLIIISPFIIDTALKAGIEKAIKTQLKVDASVARVHLNIGQGTIEVNSLKIGNPKGYEFKNIAELGSLKVKIVVRSLFTKMIEVNQINLSNVVFVIEQKGLSSNLNDILKAMPKKPAGEAEAEEPAAKQQKKVHIALLDISNIDVKAKVLPIAGKTDVIEFKISDLHFTNLGGEKTTVADIVGKIFTELSNQIVKQGSNLLPKDLTGPINENIGQAGEMLQKVGAGAIGGDSNEVQGLLKGLFQKKKK